MSARPQFAPTLKLGKLWAGASQKGTPRLVGKLGSARIVILPNRDRASEADHTHDLLLSQADASAAPAQTYGASVDVCRLETATSARGHQYLRGWLAGSRVVVVRDTASPDDAPAYFLRLTEVAAKPRPQDAARQAPTLPGIDRPSLALDAASAPPAQPALPIGRSPSPAQAAMRARQADRPRQDGPPVPRLVDDAVPF